MQGVRQLAPSEVLASAPGGSDSMVSETFALLDMLGMKSQLGVQLPQPASASALATTHTRTIGVITTASPADTGRPPAATIRVPRLGCNIRCTAKAAAAWQPMPP